MVSKSKVFIASSTEGEKYSKTIQSLLNENEYIQATHWTSLRAFQPSRSFFDSLNLFLDEYDFAVIVLTPDDVNTSRDETNKVPRDNLLFELGLFMGGITTDRTYFVYDSTKDLRLPSDLDGVNAITFIENEDTNLEESLRKCCKDIAKCIEKFDRRRNRIDNQNEENIRFFEDREYVPDEFKIENILKYIAQEGLNLMVIGRTNVAWFRRVEDKKNLYREAIDNGCNIKFVIQHEFVENENLEDDNERNENLNDHKEAVKVFKELCTEFNLGLKKDSFQLCLTKNAINNSMTGIYTGDTFKQFHYDLDIDRDRKPFLFFPNDSVFPGIRKKFLSFIDDSMNIVDYERQYDNAVEETRNLIKDYSQFSSQRKNDNEKLLYHYFKRKKYIKMGKFYPPASIQLLLTNQCTANCVMCEHRNISLPQNELSTGEIKHIFEHINDIGTKNIIISGGEPLYKENCIDLLKNAKEKYRFNFGLQTNGIKRITLDDKDELVSITEKDASEIKNIFDWVQLSIDSFESDVYKEIRGVDCFKIVKETLKNLEKEKVNVEVCFTIQKLNIEEAINIIENGEVEDFPDSKIRFKFAHGPDNENNFLIGDRERIHQLVGACMGEKVFNTEYISEMFEKRYFNINDIAKGKPLSSKNSFFEEWDYTCHVLKYSCIIDAEGNLFPCCFLFDDNKGDDSEIRNMHNLGSLRGDSGFVPRLDEDNNKLEQLLRENIGKYYNKTIPIDGEACHFCTRHFYQNEFLNKFKEIINKNQEINFIYPWEEIEDGEKIWI